jgi:hypothetical protein
VGRAQCGGGTKHDEHDAHVVTGAARETVVHEQLANLLWRLAGLELGADKLAQLVVAHDVVNAVAAEHEKLVGGVAPLDAHARLSRDELLVGLERGVALEPKVAKAARHGDAAAYATTKHSAAGRNDAVLFKLDVGLVVHRELEHVLRPRVAENAPRVADVGADNVGRRDDREQPRGADFVRARRELGVALERLIGLGEGLAQRDGQRLG